MNDLPRAFKGIFIPREIWLHNELTSFEKNLWAEIDSLDTPEQGCYASNEYFCKFFGVQPKTLQRGIKKLRSLNLVKIVEFNGRKRVIRSSLQCDIKKFNDTQDIFDPSDRTDLSHLPGHNCPVSLMGDSIERENKVKNKDKKDPPLTPPTENETPATPEEEEELNRRFKARPKGAPMVFDRKAWNAVVLKQMRSEAKETGDLLKSNSLAIEHYRKVIGEYRLQGCRSIDVGNGYVELARGQCVDHILVSNQNFIAEVNRLCIHHGIQPFEKEKP